MKKSILFGLLVFLFSSTVALAQTGKITGRITDAETGEPLPGVNVIVVGTEMGAATGVDGYYTVINVPPGTYNLRASFIGYATVTVEDLRVNIDLTTTQNFQLQSEAIAGQEVVVEAQAPVVQPDVSANVANVSAVEVEDVPVAGVSEFINLQAGVEPGMTIRGSGMGQMSFVVDGMSTRSGRTDDAYTNISYTAISEFQIQTGGFNAEYGNVRSGLINIVTKEGGRDRYSADIFMRYNPPQKKYFGPHPSDPGTYWMRPHLDPEVAFEGTKSGAWDTWTQRQYQQFDGWNSKVENYNAEPGQHMTPEQAQQLWLWRHRKDFEPTIPEIDTDASFGGPIPFISNSLGDLRFFASHRQTQKPYVYEMYRDRYRSRTSQLKLTSNLSSNIKLMATGMLAGEYGMNIQQGGVTSSMFKGELPKYPWQWSNAFLAQRNGEEEVYTWHNFNPMDVERNMFSLKMTHTLSQNTVYEAEVGRSSTDYFTRPGRERDLSPVRMFGTFAADEAPAGWVSDAFTDPVHTFRLGGHWGSARDSSYTTNWNASFDITSQVAHFSQLKAGVEYINRFYDLKYGEWDPFFVHHDNPKIIWSRGVSQFAGYVQNKLEFQGLIANVGVRVDAFKPNSEYYEYTEYDRAFSPFLGFKALDTALDTEPVPTQVSVSPRLGISYPITVNSKLFFNYGHFRQMLNLQNLVGVRMVHGNQIDRIGNPEHPMPRTVAYELGYEHNLFNQVLLRLTGYYKSIDDQSDNVRYVSIDGQVDYQVSQPREYQDIRGFEISLNKNRGRWIRGFINYTYLVTKRGEYGFNTFFQNDFQQRNFERDYRGHYQSLPIPEPFARANISFLMPPDYGPTIAGINPLGDWRFTLLSEYRSGDIFTWEGGGSVQGIDSNVKWRDFWMFDVRLSKNFQTNFGRLQLFVDVNNIFNLKHMYRHTPWEGNRDFEHYMWSLHLPEDTFDQVDENPYQFIPGEDRPGDYRDYGVEFVPIEVGNLPEEGHERPLYWDPEPPSDANYDAETYYWYRDGQWEKADQSFVDEVMDKKAYIDMPNNTTYTFLNPRQVFFGIRLSF